MTYPGSKEELLSSIGHRLYTDAERTVSLAQQFFLPIIIQGQLTAQTLNTLPSLEQRQKLFYFLIRSRPEINEVTLLSLDHQVLSHVSRSDYKSIDQLDQINATQLVANALNGELSFGSVTYSKYLEPQMDIAIPVKEAKQALLIKVKLRWLWDLVEREKIDVSGYIYILDQQKQLIAHPDPSLVRQKIIFDMGANGLFANEPRRAYKINQYTSLTGQQVIGAAKQADGNGWWFIVELPVEEGLAPLQRIVNRFILTIGIAFLFTLLAVVYFSRLITRPLEKLEQGVKRFASGEENVSVDVPDISELASLATTFNQMARQMDSNILALRDEKERAEVTLHSLGDAVISTDKDGYVLHMNPVAERLTGWSLREACGLSVKDIFSIIDAATRKQIKNPVEKVLAMGETVYLSNHTTLIAKRGTEHQIADSAAPIRDSDGNILGMVLVFNDVTEQYKLREAASKSRRDLQAILNNSPAVIYVKDTQGRFIFINQKFENLFQIKMQAISGKTLHDVFPKKIADEMQRNDKAVLTAGQALETEETAPHSDGLRTYATIKFPLFNGDGDIYAVCGMSTDITERKRAEEHSRRTQKMNSLGNLTGGIAHDYNNMLGVVMGYAGLLEEALSDQPELAKYAHEIHHAGERGVRLTNKLLAFTRKKVSKADDLNLNTLLLNAQHMLERTLTARIKLVLDLTENPWSVWLDNSDVEDAIVNMSINAMHAIESNGQLTIQTRNQAINQLDARLLGLTAGDYVLLNITDTGCGMDEETKEKAFEPFFSTKGERGTGLGLSQVYGFVERSGGAIKIYTEPGQGTRFALYFHRYHATDGKKQLIEGNKAIDIKGSETILVVDDEPALLRLSCEILTQYGFNVISADNAKNALEILTYEKIDVLISDIIMPEMDGYQLAAIVKEKYPAIKIQLASGFADDRNRSMVDESLRQNLLLKPFNSLDLLQKIHDLLNDK
jgi:PAS domain S-box-containing protein